MELTESHDYDSSIDTVLAMFANREAITERYTSMGHREVSITECERTASELRITSSRVVDVELPNFAKKVLKPTNTMVQADVWRPDAHAWNGTFDVAVQGAPVKISGTMRLTPRGEGCTHTVTIRVDVKIPIIGGKIADWLGKNDARRTLHEEFAAAERWLKNAHS
jgi:Protein of unknown function (DUF2505)